MKKILYVLRPSISSLPPVISQLTTLLELGYDVKFLTSELLKEDKQILQNLGINYVCSSSKNSYNIYYKIINILRFRTKLKNLLMHDNYDYVWIGSGDTAKYGKKILAKNNKNHYIMNLYELYDENNKFLNSIKNLSQICDSIIVPENNRAHILKSWLKLEKKPVVLPNKPYYNDFEIDVEIEKQINRIKNQHKKIILYQGWIGGQRSITNIARGLSIIKNSDDFMILLMGKCVKEDAVSEIKKIFNNTLFIPYITPPKHLAITSLAYIGIALYDDSSLNNIFCAPNKIYEYSKYSIPILGRDIPGLTYTVGLSDAGICIDTNDINEIARGIEILDNNHDYYSKKSKEFFDNCDVKSIIGKILNEKE